MREHRVEALVLGAGIGGLAAGLELARAGIGTMMVESRGTVGGRCQTVEVDGCRLPIGTVVIPCGDFLEQFFAEADVPFDVTPLATRGMYEIAGDVVTVPERGALRLIAETCVGAADAEPVLTAINRAMRWAEPTASLSMMTWLSQYTQSPTLLNVFQALAGAYMATNSYEVSARSFIQYLKGTARAGQIGIPSKGWGAFITPLAGRFQQLGGDLRINARVERVVVEKGVVKGAVVRESGSTLLVLAKVVLSDLGPTRTVELTGSEVCDVGYLKDVAELRSSPGAALFFKHDELLDHGVGPLLPGSATRACFVITPTALVEGLAPAGQHWTEVLVTLLDSSIQTAAAAKQAVEEGIREVWRILPQLVGVSPFKVLTYRGDWPIYRAWPGTDLSVRSSIVNLFTVGDAAKPAGMSGTSAAAQTGYAAACEAIGLIN